MIGEIEYRYREHAMSMRLKRLCILTCISVSGEAVRAEYA